MKRTVIIWALLIGLVCNAFSQANVELKISYPDEPSPGRSSVVVPFANIYHQVLQVDFPLSTSSEIIIINEQSDEIVYYEQYDISRQVLVDLTTLADGIYTLRVYAFGKWWWGEFELEEDY